MTVNEQGRVYNYEHGRTIVTESASLQSLGGGLKLLAALAEGLLAVVNPSLHMRCEDLCHTEQTQQMPQDLPAYAF